MFTEKPIPLDTPSPTDPQKKVEVTSISSPPKALIIALLIIFPPAAYYLIWKNEHFYSWLPNILWISGSIGLVTQIFNGILFVPQFIVLYESLGVQSPYVIAVPFAIAFFLAIAQICWGFYLSYKLQKRGTDVKRMAAITLLFLLLIPTLMVGLVIYAMLNPILSITSQIQ